MKTYNILKIEHEINLDPSCGCRVISEFARVEVLYKSVDENNIGLFKEEVLKSINKQTSEYLNTKSRFFNLTYGHLAQYHEDLVNMNIVIVECLL